MDANINSTALFYSGKSLRDTANILLYGFRPVVLGMSVVQIYRRDPGLGYKLYPDDFVVIRLTWSARVTSSCRPVLIMDAGTFFREATYFGGNSTKNLDFKYTVQMGDSSTGVNLRYGSSPLCLASGCPVFSTCRYRVGPYECCHERFFIIITPFLFQFTIPFATLTIVLDLKILPASFYLSQHRGKFDKFILQGCARSTLRSRQSQHWYTGSGSGQLHNFAETPTP